MNGERPPPQSHSALARDEGPAGRAPVDFDQLVAGLRSLGVQRGQDLLVHCSMRRVGPVDGGAATLLAAIRDVAGLAATIVVPAQTAWTSPTSAAFRAATAGLDQDGYARYVATLPRFDQASTPSAGMGAFAEHLRTRPGARRSAHPQSSFAALGPGAAVCTSGHDPDCHLGERSPLRWLYDGGAAILLLGVDYAVCTAFHLAEYRIARQAPVRGADLDDSDFAQLGAALDAAWPNGGIGPDPDRDAVRDAAPRRGRVGMGASRRVPVRTAVDFAVDWLTGHRNWVKDDK
jgi:aminoglycoside 3-N-acetyltransferase